MKDREKKHEICWTIVPNPRSHHASFMMFFFVDCCLFFLLFEIAWSLIRNYLQPFSSGDEIIRHGENVDDIKIETADISNKFKFFETYKPAEQERKQFRITPPREGVNPANGDTNGDANGVNGTNGTNGGHHYTDASAKAAQRSHTTTKMLSMFRQMEEAERTPTTNDGGLKPLKCFTPPPDDNRRIQAAHSESENDCTDSETEEEEEEEEGVCFRF